MQPLGVTLFRQCARCRLCALWAVSTGVAALWRLCYARRPPRAEPSPIHRQPSNHTRLPLIAKSHI